MQEIEILVECYSPKELILSKLSSFSYHGTKNVKDIYFYDPLRKSLHLGKDNRLEACFRLRDKDGKFFMTYKKDFFDDNGVWIYSDEHEIEISDIETSKQIIKHLGLEELVVVDNTKHIFTNTNYEIILEEVENLGLFMEIELLDKNIEPEQILNKKDEMKKYLISLGLQISEELNSGKPELLLKKHDSNKEK